MEAVGMTDSTPDLAGCGGESGQRSLPVSPQAGSQNYAVISTLQHQWMEPPYCGSAGTNGIKAVPR